MIINMNGAKAPETPSPVMQEKTVTPETLPVVIGADEGYDGLSQVTVNPDAQLKAENIRSGKTIFGVTGTFEGEAISTPVPYGTVLRGMDTHVTQILVAPSAGITPTRGTYAGPINYLGRFAIILDADLKRIVGPNTFSTSMNTWNDQYIVSYEGGTITYTSNIGINLPHTYNTVLSSSINTTIKLMACVVAGIDIYGRRWSGDVFIPLEILECECVIESSSTKDYLFIKPTTPIVIEVPPITNFVSSSTVEDIAGHSNGKMVLELRLYPVDVDFTGLYE